MRCPKKQLPGRTTLWTPTLARWDYVHDSYWFNWQICPQVHPRTGKRKAKIAIKFWSVYDPLMEGAFYVNNHLEGSQASFVQIRKKGLKVVFLKATTTPGTLSTPPMSLSGLQSTGCVRRTSCKSSAGGKPFWRFALVHIWILLIIITILRGGWLRSRASRRGSATSPASSSTSDPPCGWSIFSSSLPSWGTPAFKVPESFAFNQFVSLVCTMKIDISHPGEAAARLQATWPRKQEATIGQNQLLG